MRGKSGTWRGAFLSWDLGIWNWRSKGHQGKRLSPISYKPNPRHDGSQHLPIDTEQAADHAIAPQTPLQPRNRQLASLLPVILDPARAPRPGAFTPLLHKSANAAQLSGYPLAADLIGTPPSTCIKSHTDKSVRPYSIHHVYLSVSNPNLASPMVIMSVLHHAYFPRP